MQFGFLGLLRAFFFASIVPSLKDEDVIENTFSPVEGGPIIEQAPRDSTAIAPPKVKPGFMDISGLLRLRKVDKSTIRLPESARAGCAAAPRDSARARAARPRARAPARRGRSRAAAGTRCARPPA